MNDFVLLQAVTALTLLLLKVGLKSYIRWLSVSSGMPVISDAVRSFGVDLAMIGFALIIGGIVSKGIKLTGEGDALAFLGFIVCVFFAFLLYGGVEKTKSSVTKWSCGSLSWLAGFVPYSGSILYLTAR